MKKIICIIPALLLIILSLAGCGSAEATTYVRMVIGDSAPITVDATDTDVADTPYYCSGNVGEYVQILFTCEDCSSFTEWTRTLTADNAEKLCFSCSCGFLGSQKERLTIIVSPNGYTGYAVEAGESEGMVDFSAISGTAEDPTENQTEDPTENQTEHQTEGQTEHQTEGPIETPAETPCEYELDGEHIVFYALGADLYGDHPYTDADARYSNGVCYSLDDYDEGWVLEVSGAEILAVTYYSYGGLEDRDSFETRYVNTTLLYTETEVNASSIGIPAWVGDSMGAHRVTTFEVTYVTDAGEQAMLQFYNLNLNA